MRILLTLSAALVLSACGGDVPCPYQCQDLPPAQRASCIKECQGQRTTTPQALE